MTDKRPRIILGVTSPASLVLLEGFPARLVRDGWDVHVVCAPGPQLEDLRRSLGVETHELRMVREPSPLNDIRALFDWMLLLARLRPDVVFVGTPKAGMLAMLSAVLTRCPNRIYHMRGLRLETAVGLRRWVYSLLERMTFAASTSSVVVSPSLRAELVRQRLAPASKLVVLGRGSSNGVDTDRFRPREQGVPAPLTRASVGLADDLPVLGFIGRLHPDKGVDRLIEASEILSKRGIAHQLLVVGGSDGVASEAIFARLVALGGKVSATGAVADSAPYYSLMDVFCLPTLREGFPNVALEAAASGLPTITTNATGAIDAVVDGVTGVIVPAGDAVSLAAALEAVLSDECWRRQAGEQARRLAEQYYTRSSVHTRLEAYLRESVDERTRGLANSSSEDSDAADDRKWSGVMHVFSALGRGGAELRTLDVVRATGMRFAFLSVSGEKSALDDEVISEGHVVCHVRVRGIRGVLVAARAMKDHRIQILHSHLGVASAPVFIAALMSGVRVRIAHCRSDNIGGRRSAAKSVYLALSRTFVRLAATDIVAVSPASLEGSGLVRGRWLSRGKVIPNGIDAAGLLVRAEGARADRDDDDLVVAHVARRERSKNRTRALQIWRELALTRKSRLKLIGSMSDDESRLASEIASDPDVLATGSRIEFVGESYTVPEHLGQSDVLLVTSAREGLPGVVLESLACGTPVVASDLPGVRWIAAETEGVRVVSLDESNLRWVETLAGTTANREFVAQAFSESPFQLSRAVSEHLVLWRHEPRWPAEAPPVLRFFALTKLHRDSAGRTRAHTPLMSNEEWEPFLRFFSRVEIFTRVQPGVRDDAGYLLDDPRISVIAMPYYARILDFVRHSPSIRRFLRSQIEGPQFAYGVWAPSQIAPYVSRLVAREGGGLLVRLIGDPEDVAAAILPRPFGGLAGRAARQITARTVRRASAVIYVTLRTLQEKYPAPPGAKVLARTNLRLTAEVLEARRDSYESFEEQPEVSIVAVGSQQQNYKGHDLLIDGVARLRHNGHDVTLTLVGQGALHESLVAQAANRDLDVRFVRRAGDIADVARLVAEHDIFVMPSRTEGMPKALLEAMAVGVFSLGASVGGIVEILGAPHRFRANDVESLVERLEHFLVHRDEVLAGVKEQERAFSDIWENHSGAAKLVPFLAEWTGRTEDDGDRWSR